jgi:hypothetical protein
MEDRHRDRHRLSCCLLQLECMLGESEIFTDRSIKIKLMMLFSITDIKKKKRYPVSCSPTDKYTQFSSLTKGQVTGLYNCYLLELQCHKFS